MLHLLDHDPLFIRLCCAALVGAVQEEEYWGKLQNFTIISPVDGLICFDSNAWCFLTVAVAVAVSCTEKGHLLDGAEGTPSGAVIRNILKQFTALNRTVTSLSTLFDC